ncbi:hypothetical protein K438DRAFT_1103513 [Mycena galopus ATCC 62051]|nr:hypothetical protein K438DRAFT_1103513 [Mycena galopus ATCC 62051]
MTKPKFSSQTEVDTEEENGAEDGKSTVYIDETDITLVGTNSAKLICAASLSPAPPSSTFCLYLPHSWFSNTLNGYSVSRLPRPSALAICSPYAFVVAIMDGDLLSPNSGLDISAPPFLSSNNGKIDTDGQADKVDETDSAEDADLTLVGGSEEATPDLPTLKGSCSASAPPFVPSPSETRVDNDKEDPDDRAGNETNSVGGADLTLVEKNEKVATPNLPPPKAGLNASVSTFVPSARFAVHDVIPSPTPLNPVSFDCIPKARGPIVDEDSPSSPARSALSSTPLNPASSEFVPKVRDPALMAPTTYEKSGPSAAAARIGPSRTPLNPASSEFIPKALKSIVDKNSAPSPIPGLAFAPIKQEIVFRRAPPRFWSPGGSAIAIVAPSSLELDTPISVEPVVNVRLGMSTGWRLPDSGRPGAPAPQFLLWCPRPLELLKFVEPKTVTVRNIPLYCALMSLSILLLESIGYQSIA